MKLSITAIAQLPLICGLMCSHLVHANPIVTDLTLTESGELDLTYQADAEQAVTVFRSLDLRSGTWQPALAVRAPSPARLNDPQHFPSAFYYLTVATPPEIPPSAEWSNTIAYDDAPFQTAPAALTTDGIPLRWVKFFIFPSDPTRVYFQNTNTYALHYPFAAAHLPPFAGLTATEYTDAITRGGIDTQPAISGTVLFAPDVNEFGIQFIGEDAYPPGWTSFLYELVRGSITGIPGDAEGFYMPVAGQHDAAHDNEAHFTAEGIALDSVRRWAGTANGCYSNGWAVGRLTYVTRDDIQDAFENGTLRFDDILLTDETPAEVPDVAGIITLSPSTPNSHVALLSQSRATPFAYIQDPATVTTLNSLIGKEILYRNVDCRTDFTDLDTFTAAQREALRTLKSPVQIAITPRAAHASLAIETTTLTRSDFAHFGGKAANFGVLRRIIPDNSPHAIAFSFNLWAEYLTQILPTGKTLQQEIDDRLAGQTWPPADIVALDTSLDEIRDLFKDTADFTATQKTAILAALTTTGGFTDDRKIRFRSSTNVEDSATFSGAGLYDSFSGCIADDTDGDDLGPSHCDPTKSKERGVFRAMRKVFASFYNTNAYLARLKHGVPEADAGMAILAHYSFPDETELANGVITYPTEYYYDSASFGQPIVPFHYLRGQIVTGVGAASITNPTGAGEPEVATFKKWIGDFELNSFSFSLADHLNFSDLTIQQRAADLPLGRDSILDTGEYDALHRLFHAVYAEWRSTRPPIPTDENPFTSEPFTLDFEYKKIVTDTGSKLIIKQVREVPPPPPASAPVLFPGKHAIVSPWQGHTDEANFGPYGIHRLKSHWDIGAAGIVDFNQSPLPSSPYFTTDWSAPRGGAVATLGDIHLLPDYTSTTGTNSAGSFQISESWTDTIADQSVTLTLKTTFPEDKTLRQCPVVFPAELSYSLVADYPSVPQPNNISSTTEAIVLLPTLAPVTGGNSSPTTDDGITVSVPFLFTPYEPAGHLETRSIQFSGPTTITGLTTAPIPLTDPWSRTAYPQRHNWEHYYVFEPALAPDLPAAARQELLDADIRHIIATIPTGPGSVDFKYVGFDGTLRDIP